MSVSKLLINHIDPNPRTEKAFSYICMYYYVDIYEEIVGHFPKKCPTMMST